MFKIKFLKDSFGDVVVFVCVWIVEEGVKLLEECIFDVVVLILLNFKWMKKVDVGDVIKFWDV